MGTSSNKERSVTSEDAAPSPEATAAERLGNPTYTEARHRKIVSAIQMTVYGVPFVDDARAGEHVSMMFCGFRSEEDEYRQCTTRIWHLPAEKILATGLVSDFRCDGDDVHFFDVPRDIDIIEEQYISISLGALVRDYLAAQRSQPGAPTGVFAARVGDVLEQTGEGAGPGVIIALQRPVWGGFRPRFPGPGLEGGGTSHTTWVWTKEVENSRYDPEADDGESFQLW